MRLNQTLLSRNKHNNFKMLGLTATPFRTSESEAGLLKKVFPDDIIFAEHLRLYLRIERK